MVSIPSSSTVAPTTTFACSAGHDIDGLLPLTRLRTQRIEVKELSRLQCAERRIWPLTGRMAAHACRRESGDGIRPDSCRDDDDVAGNALSRLTTTPATCPLVVSTASTLSRRSVTTPFRRQCSIESREEAAVVRLW